MDKKKLTTYLWMTFGITWICWWSLAFLTHMKIVDSSSKVFTLLHMAGGFGPTIGSLYVGEKSLNGIVRFVFSGKKKTLWVLLLFCLMQAMVIGFSSMEMNPAVPWWMIPVVLFSATFFGGGNEELGWRGVMQCELEKKYSFVSATLLTGSVWMLWHVPLWFIEGTSQQSMNFVLYAIYGIILSFWLAAVYRKTNCVFTCCVFHGFSNMMLSIVVIKINWILIMGLILSMMMTFWISGNKTKELD